MDQKTVRGRRKDVYEVYRWEIEQFPWNKRWTGKTGEEESVGRSKEFYIRREASGEALPQ